MLALFTFYVGKLYLPTKYVHVTSYVSYIYPIMLTYVTCSQITIDLSCHSYPEFALLRLLQSWKGQKMIAKVIPMTISFRENFMVNLLSRYKK